MKSSRKIVGSRQPACRTGRLAVGNAKPVRWVFVFLLSVVCGLSSINVSAQSSPADVYTNATALYKANQFEPAAQQYEKLIKEGYKSAEVYYNLGNCYYKLNNTGKAILYYERAHRLTPDDEDVAHNLKLANLKVVDKLIAVPQLAIVTSWNNFMESQSAKGWGVFALISLWLALVFVAVYFFIGIKKLSATISVLLFVLSVAFVSLAFKQNDKGQNPDEAVLMAASAFIKSAPDSDATDLVIIHEGLKFNILDNVGTWYKIRLADGKVGWLERNNFEKI